MSTPTDTNVDVTSEEFAAIVDQALIKTGAITAEDIKNLAGNKEDALKLKEDLAAAVEDGDNEQPLSAAAAEIRAAIPGGDKLTSAQLLALVNSLDLSSPSAIITGGRDAVTGNTPEEQVASMQAGQIQAATQAATQEPSQRADHMRDMLEAIRKSATDVGFNGGMPGIDTKANNSLASLPTTGPAPDKGVV